MAGFVECLDLKKQYGAVKAVDGISIFVDRGERLVIMGRSGSGKSSFLQTFALLQKPDSGKILMEGQEVFPSSTPNRSERRDQEQAFRSKFGFVFQNFSLWPHRSVLGNVCEGLRVVKGFSKHEAERHAVATLRRVHVEHLRDADPAHLSGGEAQRVAIARALAMDPEVLCLDEITSALDPEQIASVLALVRELAEREKKTMLIVTHHLEFARKVADRVVFIDHGRIHEEGPPSEMFIRPRTDEFGFFLNNVLAGK